MFKTFVTEFNVHQPSPLNEKVLKDKRKKLRDTLDRVLSMYVSFKLFLYIVEIVHNNICFHHSIKTIPISG